jgi:chitin-binding protein
MIRRLAFCLAAAGAAALVPALPASAHGAPTTPISRTAACASAGGTATGTAACKAARKANGGAFGAFDNLRLPNVGGNDRRAVPDGKLCSGGIAAYKGLDLARDDFPSTTVTGGKTLAVKYRTTIPHEGTFRLYLTRQGYDPGAKLTWDDLGSKPIAEIKNPPVRSGAYVMSAKLPERTGRHILYVVWQNSSTPDTYYSCSDLVFKAAAAAATKSPKPSPSRSAAQAATKPAADSTSAAAEAPAPTTEPPAEQAQALTPVAGESQITLGHQIVAGALILGIGAGLWAAIGGLLRRRRENR